MPQSSSIRRSNSPRSPPNFPLFAALAEPLIPSNSHHAAIDISAPTTSNEDDYLRAPDAQFDDILLPPAQLLEPLSSAGSTVEQPPAAPSLFRRLFFSSLLMYLTVLCIASLAVVAFASNAGCSRSLVIYVTGNGTVSGLLALLTLYAARSAPVDLSQLAVSNDRTEPIRLLTLTCVKQLLGMADFVFFIIGHIAYFSSSSSSSQCAARSPVLHSFALASFISGYIGYVVPLLTFLYLALSYRHIIFRPRGQPAQRHRPAHQHEIAACEKREWVSAAVEDGLVAGDEAAVVCSICYVDFVDGEVLMQLPCDANHLYHEPCISQWLSIRDTCPLCKTRLSHSLRKAGKLKAAVGQRAEQTVDRTRAAPAHASINEIAPFLPGTMAASFSLTTAYQQSQQHEQKQQESCPAPSPAGTPECESPLPVGEKQVLLDSECGGNISIHVRDSGVEEQAVLSPQAVTSSRSAAVAAALLRLATSKAAVSRPSV